MKCDKKNLMSNFLFSQFLVVLIEVCIIYHFKDNIYYTNSEYAYVHILFFLLFKKFIIYLERSESIILVNLSNK